MGLLVCDSAGTVIQGPSVGASARKLRARLRRGAAVARHAEALLARAKKARW